MRHPLIIGNWKLNGNKYIVNHIISSLQNELSDIQDRCTIVIAPPIIYLDLAKYYLNNSCILLGSQNIDIHLSGPFTGEVSALMLKDIGVKYVIIGHSERRIYHKEDNNIISEKFAIIKDTNLIPVLCVGENERENKNGQTEIVCIKQIDTIIKRFGIKSFENSVIAYEPIWAIGTGKSATPIQIQKVHKFIRNYIAQYDKLIANKLIIQYGGSVNDQNASNLFAQLDVDGFLVGNASLKPDIFSKIIKSITKKQKN